MLLYPVIVQRSLADMRTVDNLRRAQDTGARSIHGIAAKADAQIARAWDEVDR